MGASCSESSLVIGDAPRSRVSRRSFVGWGVGLLLARPLAACGVIEPERNGHRRLTARPATPSLSPPLGESALGLASERDGFLYVPQSYSATTALPLLVMLHGASQDASSARSFGQAADDLNAVVLIPESRAYTWDFLTGGYGPDVAFLDRALTHTFARVAVDTSRIALAGFSDGASYALSLGVSNGDLFSHLIGFSPGFLDYGEPITGRPDVFVSHGVSDSILSVRGSRDRIVPELREKGHSIVYREFDGGHTVPNEIATEAMEWFLD